MQLLLKSPEKVFDEKMKLQWDVVVT